ncbi:FAD-dependent pyridine nucleotide-disulfide oxidoreductase [Desulforamulus reducens MI-1]|uniref:FAD-dependent pyridine nucleotide-disulfide oxidoreductase n=1 Tax=Desulforamulus reducens (strain ATCC BAA-1160 / DSM 100696 / MI-1) TaxID=349161 RepID=A4J8R7_DESRM|nr:DsrE/DsrF/DrsH-like family protein [Desulforamulus reducens]ABO51470.1 FAD-dependent pyridine nucleotide-disulfide oxidoreductase [Desulforamulus reducens MI-1]
MTKKVLIVGGVAGGASAAARLRRLDEDAEIILFERGEYISFANCGLPYYLGGVIKERENLLVQTVQGMQERFNVDIRIKSEVTKILRETKEVEVLSQGKTYRESYDYLVLSPGADPILPPIPGIQREGIYTLRNMADVDRIKSLLEEKKPKRAAVVGGGYVGIEMAENLKHAGLDVVLIEAAEQVMGPLDVEMARIVEKELMDNGIRLVLQDAVQRFQGEREIEIILGSGKQEQVDMVIMAAGVRPETKLAKEAGLEIGERGGIRVDEHLRTSDPAIYAVGDAIEVKDRISGEYAIIPLAGPANKQGRIVANNICGGTDQYLGSLGTSIIKVFHVTAAAAGNNEKILRRAGIPYLKSFTHSGSHAGYYPGAFILTIKLLFSPEDGKILGAQIVGREGVDKRIDVLATAIKHGLTVYDLEELELAYAPPYSSAKDPVNMAGFTAANILKGDVKILHWEDLQSLNRAEYVILDVRTKEEYENGSFEGSIHLPVDNIRQRLDEIPKDKKIIIYCKVGLRGYIAYRILAQRGYDVYNLSGGYEIYLAEEYKYAEGIDLDEQMTKFEQIPAPAEMQGKTIRVDACGLQCPGPIMRVYQEMEKIQEGEILEVQATDPSFPRDVKAWSARTGNTLLQTETTDKGYRVMLKKGSTQPQACGNDQKPLDIPHGKSLIVFSSDLDKAIASFIIANGGASMGRKVTMFFTFWGLNILRKDVVTGVNKNFMERMFGWMMPRGSKRLGLSKMNMAGMGPTMIRNIMKKKNIASLEELIQQAQKSGVRLVACTMSMDVMGIKAEELIDGIEYGGVASYLAEAEESDVNLFV